MHQPAAMNEAGTLRTQRSTLSPYDSYATSLWCDVGDQRVLGRTCSWRFSVLSVLETLCLCLCVCAAPDACTALLLLPLLCCCCSPMTLVVHIRGDDLTFPPVTPNVVCVCSRTPSHAVVRLLMTCCTHV